MAFSKGSKLFGIVRNKCPRCHEGDLFTHPNPYNLAHFSDMPKRCPVCDQSYEPEPNFFYGSMYVSYGYAVALFVATYIVANSWLGLGLWQTVGALGLVSLLLGPFIFRLSRSTYFHLFVHFDPEAAEEHHAAQTNQSSREANPDSKS
jgi:uncharacterized protein (DUF983 family)